MNAAAVGLRERVRREVRAAPGVYTLFDTAGVAVYVGKSVNLRSRLLSHLNAKAGIDNPQRHLAYAISDFAVRETPGELLALLLEDALIKKLAPRANTRQRDYREYCYLLLTRDAFPTLRIVDSPDAGAGKLFGPYRDRYAAGDLFDLIREHFGLRSCSDPVPHRRSSNFDLGRCTGPCRGAIGIVEYGEIVTRVARFLDGNEEWIVERLSEGIAAEAARLRFEEAARLQVTREYCERFARRRRFHRRFRESRIRVAEPACEYTFQCGALVDLRAVDGQPLEVPGELTAEPGDARFLFDRANVVFDWIRRADGETQKLPAGSSSAVDPGV